MCYFMTKASKIFLNILNMVLRKDKIVKQN